MFTGIISDIGTILKADQRGDLRIVIGCSYAMDGVTIGGSIACSGACLTVVDKGIDGDGGTQAGGGIEAAGGWFAVDVSGETLSKTATGMWNAGRRLNLERALKVGDELGGHIVTGHVDGTGTITAITPEGDSHRITIAVARELAPFIAAKGSITVDGVSLTVNAVEDAPAGVNGNKGGNGPYGTTVHLNIIPHTRDVTTLGQLAVGAAVNIEIDTLARYLQRMHEVMGN